MSRLWAKGSTGRWRRTRALVLLRDKGLCQIRLRGTWTNQNGQPQRCQVRADCVHHVKGKAHGDRLADLVAACTPCNLKVGDPNRGRVNPKQISRW